MVVGVGIIDIYIFDSRSLKSKRGVLRSILKRTQNRFNISIAEVGNNDDWKRGRIGFSIVGNDTGYVNSKMDKILKWLSKAVTLEKTDISKALTDYMKEIMVNDHGELQKG